MHRTEPATADDSHAALEKTLWAPDCGDMSPLSRRDTSRAKSAAVPAQSRKPATSHFAHLLSLPEGANVG